jgi:hypothetical protein
VLHRSFSHRDSLCVIGREGHNADPLQSRAGSAIVPRLVPTGVCAACKPPISGRKRGIRAESSLSAIILGYLIKFHRYFASRFAWVHSSVHLCEGLLERPPSCVYCARAGSGPYSACPQLVAAYQKQTSSSRRLPRRVWAGNIQAALVLFGMKTVACSGLRLPQIGARRWSCSF